MTKQLLALVIFFTVLVGKSSAQVAPALVSFTDSVGSNFAIFNMKYIPHDTGTIRAEVQLDQGTGNVVYDSTYVLRAVAVKDTEAVSLYIGPLLLCGNFTMFLNMSNDSIQGDVNPIFSFNIVCTDIEDVVKDNFTLTATGSKVQLLTSQLPNHAVAAVYDITGRRITEFNVVNLKQDITLNTAGGIYFLKIISEGSVVYTTRFAML